MAASHNTRPARGAPTAIVESLTLRGAPYELHPAEPDTPVSLNSIVTSVPGITSVTLKPGPVPPGSMSVVKDHRPVKMLSTAGCSGSKTRVLPVPRTMASRSRLTGSPTAGRLSLSLSVQQDDHESRLVPCSEELHPRRLQESPSLEKEKTTDASGASVAILSRLRVSQSSYCVVSLSAPVSEM